MTRVATTWASALLGLTVSSAAFAQIGEDTLPDPDPKIDPRNTEATAPADVDVNVRTPDTVTAGRDTYALVPTPGRTYDDRPYRPLSRVGIALAAGGGAGGFTNETLRNTTDVGSDWNFRATIGTRWPIAFEGSYIGSAQRITALGLDGDAVLVGNGVQGAVRLNATLDFRIQPFVFAGIGWRRYDLMNVDTNLSDVSGSDDVLEVPMGIGIAGRWNGLILDARGEYRAATREDLLPKDNQDDHFATMNRWGVNATIGVEL